MREFNVGKNEEGLSVIKLSRKVLSKAPNSLLYKFIRNKNIELNGKRTSPDTLLKNGDRLMFFLSDETYESFAYEGFAYDKDAADAKGAGLSAVRGKDGGRKDAGIFELAGNIIYEDENIVLINKPAGLLSQGDVTGEASLNDALLKYLKFSPVKSVIKPSVCNRLDKNTSGLIAAGKSAGGLAALNSAFAGRKLKKVYAVLVCGDAAVDGEFEAYLKKDEKTNTADVRTGPHEGYDRIRTGFCVQDRFKKDGEVFTFLYAELITGKPHQIRAHLKHMGFPVLGDRKYCTKRSKAIYERLAVKRQLLHSLSLTFPETDDVLSYLAGKTFYAPLPGDFAAFLEEN